MTSLDAALRPHARLLIEALKAPSACAAWDETRWDVLVRTARSARLLGTLAVRLGAAGPAGAIPEPVGRHLAGALAEARYCRQMALYEMASVAKVFHANDIPVVLLKGAAYIAQSLPMAEGRMPRDLDVLVPRNALDRAEQLLRTAGWAFESDLTDYDQHYYRAWSHELPPMRLPAHAFELDVHHTILPPIGRLKPDAVRLVADSIALPDRGFRVLRPADQMLHAAVHLFQDSDCVGRLRDLVDIDGLARHFAQSEGERFWSEMIESAARHGLGRPLWYSLLFCRSWLATPVPEGIWQQLERSAPSGWPGGLVARLAARVLPPIDPDSEPTAADRWARRALEFRAVWLRMPPLTLAYHGASKLLRSMRAGAVATKAAG